VLPNHMRPDRALQVTRTAVDTKLMERTGLDEFSLRRLRKSFMVLSHRMPYLERRGLSEGGTSPRFRLMVATIHAQWPDERWSAWLCFLEHSQQDIDEMCKGEYPISPYLIRVFSALFGIKVEFLLLGTPPCVDKVGANIDVWPMTSIR
jgi:hypothetical protein